MFPPPLRSRTLGVRILDDALPDGLRTLEVRLSNPGNALAGAALSSLISITDHEAQARVWRGWGLYP